MRGAKEVVINELSILKQQQQQIVLELSVKQHHCCEFVAKITPIKLDVWIK